jgi:uncharacterized protein (TIGR02588 family)
MAISIHDPKGDAPEGRPDGQADARRDVLRQPSSERREAGRTSLRTTAEWVTLAVSSLIVLSLIGLTTYFYLTGSSAPAAVEVEPHLAETYQAGSRFYLPLTIRNTGGETGEEVRVRVSVTDRSGRQEAAEVMVTFLAGGGSSKAVAAFGSDPRQGQVEAVVVSYLEP